MSITRLRFAPSVCSIYACAFFISALTYEELIGEVVLVFDISSRVNLCESGV
jgi:hypothetical protein